MSSSVGRKPANRPSRKSELVEAAVHLFAIQPWEMVTVADIVASVGMTPAAFYYHFSSREELLEEVVSGFAEQWVDSVEQLLEQAGTTAELASIPGRAIDEFVASEDLARIYFLMAGTAPPVVERISRDAKARLSSSATTALLRVDPDVSPARAGVVGVSFMVVLELALRSRLTRDEAYTTLGPRRYSEELQHLTLALLGASPSS